MEIGDVSRVPTEASKSVHIISELLQIRGSPDVEALKLR